MQIADNSDVVLVSMPFAPITHPSLALGCLAGALRQAGILTRSLHFSLDFAETIGLKSYHHINFAYSFHSEWVFSRAAFPGMKRDDDGFFQVCPVYQPSSNSFLSREEISKVRDAADGFINRCVDKVLALNPKIVGCSLSFFQTCASLALLRRIREAAPGVATVIGGPNCEGVMGGELHRSFPWVDYVFSGEADESFPDFCRAFLRGEKIGGGRGWNLPEVLTPHDRPSDGTFREPGRGTVGDLSNLPIPFFDDYFEALGKSGVQDNIIPGLLLEASRGCWLGAKNPCFFCGLNGLSRKQRAKSPDRAYREIIELAKRHGVTSIEMTDNIIDPAHIEQLLPRFEGSGVSFMYEAPATLSREQMRRLADAGVCRMQAGIEQLHDESLAALGKKNRVFHNIRFLKWAREYGIDVAWNCLYGFPGEKDDWHGEAADLVPLLTHLQAPSGGVPIRFDRFSPYFNERDRYGLTLRPIRAYYHIYPLDEEAMSRFAYFFERADASAEMEAAQRPGLELLIHRLHEWTWLFPPVFAKDRREPPVLAMTRNAAGTLVIEDTRPIAIAPRFSFDGTEAAAYCAADQSGTAEEIARVLTEHGFSGASNMPPRDVEDILQDFVAARLMVNLNGIYLALAVAAPFRGYISEERNPGGGFRRKRSATTIEPGKLTVEQAFGLRFKTF